MFYDYNSFFFVISPSETKVFENFREFWGFFREIVERILGHISGIM